MANRDSGNGSLLHNKPFRWLIGTPLTLAIGSALAIAFLNCGDPHFQWCGSPECFSNVLVIYKLPIGIATAGFALAGLWALVFRSEQTAKQIEVAESHNTYNNYLTHKSEFDKVVKAINDHQGVAVTDPHRLYHLLFKRNSPTYVSYESHGLGDEDRPIDTLVDGHNMLLIKLNEIWETPSDHFKQDLDLWKSNYFQLFYEADINMLAQGVSGTYEHEHSGNNINDGFIREMFIGGYTLKLLYDFCLPYNDGIEIKSFQYFLDEGLKP